MEEITYMSTHSEKTYIICDIDSASIGAVLFSMQFDSNLKAISLKEEKSIRIPIHSGEKVSFDDFVNKTKRVLNIVFEDLIHYTKGNLADVYMNISAPWSSSQKRIVQAEFEKEVTITKKRINDLISHELKSSLNKNVEFAAFDGLEVFERKTLDIYANGYPTLKPLGHKVTNINIKSLSSVISTSTKKMFSAVSEKHFHREPVLISNIHTQYQTIRDLLPNINSMTILDVSGEMTEFIVIEDDHLRHIASFPHGMYDMTRAYAKKLSIDENHAWQDLYLYLRDDISDRKKEVIEKTTKYAFREWVRLLYNQLDKCSAEGLLPGTFLVMSDERVVSWIQESLVRSDELTLHTHSKDPFRVMTLSQDRLKQLTDPVLRETGSFSDTALSLLSHHIISRYISH